jgi:hypothetical protein
MVEKLPSEFLNLRSLPNSPSNFAPNRRPSSAENYLVAFDASREFPQQIETVSGFCLDSLAKRFTDRTRLKHIVNAAEGIFESMELLNQGRKFAG